PNTSVPAPSAPGSPELLTDLLKISNSNRKASPLPPLSALEPAPTLAKFQSQPRCQAPGDAWVACSSPESFVFQSQPRCQAPGDVVANGNAWQWLTFQSQPRCQAPGDDRERE